MVPLTPILPVVYFYSFIYLLFFLFYKIVTFEISRNWNCSTMISTNDFNRNGLTRSLNSFRLIYRADKFERNG